MDPRPSIPPLPSPPKTSELAIASLALGILGLMCLLPLISPLLALVLGIVAVNQVKNSSGQLRGRRYAVAGIVLGGVGLVMIPIMAAMLLSALRRGPERARRFLCMSNERQIALAMIMYREETGTCPQTLGDLRKFIPSDKVLHCPSASTDASVPSYTIHCVTNTSEVMITEDPANHHGLGSNAAYGDGHVEWKSTRR
jgi:prepilin-type processing-associated H-X9-DG protein